MSEHSPLPWKVKKATFLFPSEHPSWIITTEDEKTTPVSAILQKANAELIVKVVNNYEKQSALLRELVEVLKDAHWVAQQALKQGHPCQKEFKRLDDLLKRARDSGKGL
jgi:hypothetical protein